MIAIPHLEEKKWIRAYFFKGNSRKHSIPKRQFLRLWKLWWSSDFPWEDNGMRVNVNGEKIANSPKTGKQSINTEYTDCFNEILKWVKETVSKNDKEYIKQQLQKNRAKVYIPEDLIKKANKMGVRITYSNTNKSLIRLSNSFNVVMKNNPRSIIYGNSKYNMQLKDIEDFINQRYEKHLRKIKNRKPKGGAK